NPTAMAMGATVCALIDQKLRAPGIFHDGIELDRHYQLGCHRASGGDLGCLPPRSRHAEETASAVSSFLAPRGRFRLRALASLARVRRLRPHVVTPKGVLLAPRGRFRLRARASLARVRRLRPHVVAPRGFLLGPRGGSRLRRSLRSLGHVDFDTRGDPQGGPFGPPWAFSIAPLASLARVRRSLRELGHVDFDRSLELDAPIRSRLIRLPGLVATVMADRRVITWRQAGIRDARRRSRAPKPVARSLLRRKDERGKPIDVRTSPFPVQLLVHPRRRYSADRLYRRHEQP